MIVQIWVPTSPAMLFDRKYFLPTRWEDENFRNLPCNSCLEQNGSIP